MQISKLISLPTAKLLHETALKHGYKLPESEYVWNLCKKEIILRKDLLWGDMFYPTYDILWDICTKCSKEFFGKTNADKGGLIYPYIFHSRNILDFLQQGKKQEAEDYFIKNLKTN